MESSSFMTLRYCVRHWVTNTVNATYKTSAVKVIQAKTTSNLMASKDSTKATSIKVGMMLYSEYEISECTARVPRSMSRVMPPVCRSRWKRRLSACRCENTFKEIERAAPAVAWENTSSRNSTNSEVDKRSKP